MGKRKGPKPPHRLGDYPRRAKAVTDAAYADSRTTCWRCGRTLAQHGRNTKGNPDWWTAGHVVDRDPNSPLLPEANSCNVRAENVRRQQAGPARQPAGPHRAPPPRQPRRTSVKRISSRRTRRSR